MRTILIATGNKGKLKEIHAFLGDIPGIRFVSLADIEYAGRDCQETGKTFAENAEQKARFFYEQTGYITLAEDSGIQVEALAGELGVKTRRWGAGEKASDEEWMEVFLRRMEKEKNRNAQFFTAACIYDGKHAHIFEGACKGTLVQHSSVPLERGVPLSSYFVPEGENKVFSALSVTEKNAISHRGKAMMLVKQYLKNTFI